MEKEKILVSACLLGIGCRYDGKSKPSEAVCALLKQENITLIPICPEQLGGLPTPRPKSERRKDRVVNICGEDVTIQYRKGAEEALKIAALYNCRRAILKEKSPSCGKGRIYDGSFSQTLIPGNGVCAERFIQEGIQVYGESEADSLPL